MPMVEVLCVRDEPLNVDRKRAFAEEAERILQEVLGTPAGRMRLFFWQTKPEDSHIGLIGPRVNRSRKTSV